MFNRKMKIDSYRLTSTQTEYNEEFLHVFHKLTNILQFFNITF